MQNNVEIIQINISGEDKPGMTSSLTEILARYDAFILDIGQANIHQSLTLGILFKTTSDKSGNIMKELLFKASELGVMIRFTPISEQNYDNWVGRQGKNRYIITLLGRTVTARHIAEVTRVVAQHGLNIDAIKRLTGRIPLSEDDRAAKSCIELSVRGSLTDEERAAMQERFMNLSELGLDAMAAGLPHWMSAVAAGEADFASAMLAMTSEEAEAKRRRGTDRKVRAAGFPFVKTLADFDWGFQPSVPRGLVEQLATLEFVDRGDNVVLVGSPGVGKTHLSIAIGHEAVMARKQVYFADCSRLVEDLKHASAKEALARRMRFYEHCSLLIIDELGYLDIGKEGADLLFQLVNRRYALKRSTIVTTNVPVGRWGDVFGSNVTASAVADRLCHHCAMIKITGRSYRLKDVSIGGEDGKEEGA